MIHLPYLSVARISGPDASAFLQAQLSSDIEAMQIGTSGFSNYCTPRGQVLGLLLLGRFEDHYLLVASTELLPSLLKRLGIYVMRLNVSIEMAPEMQVAGCPGDLDSVDSQSLLRPENVSLVYAVGTPQSAGDGEPDRWKVRELQSAVVWLDRNTSEKFIPQMLGFDRIGAISFSKGCYPGQEIVARTRYLGKVKRKPLVVPVEGGTDFASGSAIQIDYSTESVAGTLVDSAVSQDQNTVLFVVTRGLDAQTPRSVTFEGRTYPAV